MKSILADLHIHTGCSESGQWIKIPSSRQLTIRNTCHHALKEKGLQMIALVDSMSPLVIYEIEQMIQHGELAPLPGGGYQFHNQLTVLLGAEIETSETEGGRCHTLVFLPELKEMKRFSEIMAGHIKNINLSSQNSHMSLGKLIEITTAQFSPIIIPAHIFTPHKSLYGACTTRISKLLTPRQQEYISAVELGLSADSSMADRITELTDYTFVTSSDAHSLEKIAREYSLFTMKTADFSGLRLALSRKAGGVLRNFGMHPKLGKYYGAYCETCGKFCADQVIKQRICPYCGSKKFTFGVSNRIAAIADVPLPKHPPHRPPYHYQIPLSFIPGVGSKTIKSLLSHFGTEMHVLHVATASELIETVGEKIATAILQVREGVEVDYFGGGGKYGQLSKLK